MNPQSCGSVTLRSANPADAPVLDTAYMTHPYDRRTLIEATRQAMQIIKTKAASAHFISSINGPKSETDEDIRVCPSS